MEVDKNFYDELTNYISEEKWDYAIQIIEKSGIDNRMKAENTKNIWFHYLCGIAYNSSGRPIGALTHFGAFLHMAEDETEVKINNQMYGIKMPTLEDIDKCKRTLDDLKSRARNMLKDKPEFAGDDTKIEQKINEYINSLYKGKGKGGCFIATAVYGSYEAEQVLVLRKFRDEYLSKYLFGGCFIWIYYAISPYIANVIAKNNSLKFFVRDKFLNPFVNKLVSDAKSKDK